MFKTGQQQQKWKATKKEEATASENEVLITQQPQTFDSLFSISFENFQMKKKKKEKIK